MIIVEKFIYRLLIPDFMRDIPYCAPPDPDTKTPNYKAPPNAVDAHTHIFGPADKYPFSPDREYTPPDAGLDRFQEMHRKIGIERAVIVNASCHGTLNDVVTDAITQSNNNYRGVMNADPSLNRADYLELHRKGIRAVRFNFVEHLGGAPKMRDFYSIIDKIGGLDWHLVLHFDAKDLTSYYHMLNGLPMPYAIDHMGRVQEKNGFKQEAFDYLLELAASDKNCWVKLSGAERVVDGTNIELAVPFAKALIKAAPDRTLWGTDWPHPNIKHPKVMPNDGDLVDLIPLIVPATEDQVRLLVSNPERLYWDI